MKLTTIILFYAILICSNSKGQIMQPSINKHLINLHLGYDYNLIALNLGYGYYLSKYKTKAFIDFTQGSALIGTHNFRTQLGIASWQGSIKKFNLKSSVAFVHAQSENKAGVYNALGLNFAVNPGLTINRFSFGTDLQINPFIATHIKHSDYWKTYFYASKDGWYKNTANNLRLGFYVSGQLDKKKNIEVNFRSGYQSSGKLDRLIPRIYFNLGVNFKF
jgi:hypothetical protein